MGIFARLKPGVTLAQVQAELRGLYRAIHADQETRDFEPVVYDLHGEFTFLAGRTLRVTLLLLFGAVLLVLLIACVNVANLLLARLADRRRELAVRAALGSGQGRLVRQVLTEGLILSGCGAVLGVAFAWAAVRYFRSANPIELTIGAEVAINWPVLGFSIAMAIATTLIFALLPALRAARVDLIQHLKTGGRGSVQGRHGWAKAAVAFEIALSFLLLISSGLFLTSALRMGSEHLGFSPDNVLTARISLPPFRYSTGEQRTLLYDRLLERLERMPGASGVALTSRIPTGNGWPESALEIQGRPAESGYETHDVGMEAVSPGFFDVLNIPLRRGRTLVAQDRAGGALVVLINEALARKYFPKGDALGQRIRVPHTPMPWLTIVGVVGNLKHTELMNEMQWVETPVLYRPLAQDPGGSVEIAVRTVGSMGTLVPELQKQIAAVDPFIPVSQIESLTSRLGTTLAYPRFRAVIFAFFALGALTLAAVGLHGVLSQLVAQRIPEFGVRKAVGAQTLDLLWLVARQGGLPVIGGLGAGVCLTIAASRLLTNLLYGVRPADSSALVAVSLMLLAVAALAIALPAIRAARVDPMVALREE